jgi:hypothetical protein
MSTWEIIAFFVFLTLSEAARNHFYPPPPDIDRGATRWLKPLVWLVGVLITFAAFWVATRISIALVLAGLLGTAAVLALFFGFRRRSGGWFQFFFDLTFLAIALLMYFCVPGAGFDGTGLFASFALSILLIVDLCVRFMDKRPVGGESATVLQEP